MKKVLAIAALMIAGSAALAGNAHAGITVEGGTGAKGDGTPTDPTADYDSTRVGFITVGAQTGPNAYGAFVQTNKESNGSLAAGRVGVQAHTQAEKVQVYAEDYTHGDIKADLVEDANDATGCALLGPDENGACGTVGEDDTDHDAILIDIKP